jgi:hypothetical protein
VAGLLVAVAIRVALDSALLSVRFVPRWLPKAATWTVGFVFLLRCIEHFRRAGFFKSDSGTRFAMLDAVLYSPVCLLLAIGCIAVGLDSLSVEASVGPRVTVQLPGAIAAHVRMTRPRLAGAQVARTEGRARRP